MVVALHLSRLFSAYLAMYFSHYAGNKQHATMFQAMILCRPSLKYMIARHSWVLVAKSVFCYRKIV